VSAACVETSVAVVSVLEIPPVDRGVSIPNEKTKSPRQQVWRLRLSQVNGRGMSAGSKKRSRRM
jgi:hypothetical protein